jgi:pimeloyl-ACP methyl ester carboxylesterase
MAPVARGLAEGFRVVEPLQRGSGGEPLTVARHVADLRDLVESLGGGKRPALVGSSWGAMLALAFGAAHSSLAGPLVLIGCGTFDSEARARLRANLESRLDDDLRCRLERLPDAFPDPDERLAAAADLLLPVYSHDLITHDQEVLSCDARSNQETWDDMVRLQEDGVYPSAFAAIGSPVLMLHGAADPHPGQMIQASLVPYLPQLEYHEWERCGHYPWLERAVREEFFDVLRAWLLRHMSIGLRAP